MSAAASTHLCNHLGCPTSAGGSCVVQQVHDGQEGPRPAARQYRTVQRQYRTGQYKAVHGGLRHYKTVQLSDWDVPRPHAPHALLFYPSCCDLQRLCAPLGCWQAQEQPAASCNGRSATHKPKNVQIQSENLAAPAGALVWHCEVLPGPLGEPIPEGLVGSNGGASCLEHLYTQLQQLDAQALACGATRGQKTGGKG